LKRIHAVVAADLASRGSFRVGSVVVGQKVPETAFVSARINVEKHLKECAPWFHRQSTQVRVAFVMYVMSILHPFEDGNGRVMRALITMLAVEGDRGSAQICFLAVYTKLRQREFVSAVQWLSEGSIGQLEEFFRQAVGDFQRMELEFSAVRGAVGYWFDSQFAETM